MTEKSSAIADFADIYSSERGKSTVFTYRSGLAVYEEVFEEEKLTSCAFGAAGYPHNVLENIPTAFSKLSYKPSYAFEAEANGVSVENCLEFCEFSKFEEIKENGNKILHSVLTLKSKIAPVEVTVHTELDGTPVIVRYLEFKNVSEKDVKISNISPLSGRLDELCGWREFSKSGEIEDLFSLGYMDSSNWATEGLFKWHKLPEGGRSVFGRYEAGRFRHPMFLLRNNATGSIVNLQFGFSGGYEFAFNLQNVQKQHGFSGEVTENALLSFAIKVKAPNPQYVIAPNECFRTPKVHVGKSFGSLDSSVNQMHDHIRKSVFTLPKPNGVTGILAVGMGAERIMDMAAIKHFADTGAYVGAEAFILDAGWYCPPGREGKEWRARAGDWEFNNELYPNGFREISDYVHSKGMLFGLWFEPERFGVSSKIAKEHPEWIGTRYCSGEKIDAVNMANGEAVKYVEETLAECFEKYGVELFRLDYNIDERDINLMSGDDVPFCCSVKGYNNTVAMYERLRKRFPNVFFENCAGGGGRTDIDFLSNFHHTWVSDYQVAPRSFAITNGMTIALPPEYADRLASGMGCHTKASLDFEIRHTLFGKPTTNSYSPIGSEKNPKVLDFVKHSYDIYKKFIRPFAEDGKIYHHTPEVYGIRPSGTGIIERSAKDKTRSIIGVFRLADSADKEAVTVFPRGINSAWKYKIRFDNDFASECEECAEISGFDLVNNGIRINLEDSLTSELILLEKV